MQVSPDPKTLGPLRTSFSLDSAERGKSPEDAAKQFEEVLVREFVRTMTKGLFSGSLAGEDGAGWVKAQGEAQADVLADAVTKHLVDSGTLGVADILLQGWKTQTVSDRIPGEEPVPMQAEQSFATEDYLRLRNAIPIDGEDK